MEVLSEINRKGLDVLREILSLKDSVDNYYQRRLLKNNFIDDSEIELIRYIDKSISKELSILEPGSGYSQIPISLALIGYKCLALEASDDRYNGSLHMSKELLKIYPNMERFSVEKGRYPLDSPSADILLLCNFVSTFNVRNEDLIIDTFKNFKYCILNPSLFGFVRSKEDISDFLNKLVGLGFSCKKCCKDYYLVKKL